MICVKKMSNILNINWQDIKSALVSTLLMGILAVLVYILGVGDIFALDIKSLLNCGVMAIAAGLVSVIKSLLTTENGNFIGAVNIK